MARGGYSITVYRDRQTGRFVKRSKWEKNHGPGGRYKREKIKHFPPPLPPPIGRLREWLVTRTYDGKRKRVLDLYVVATSRERALELVLDRILQGRDDNGYDLTWAREVPWTEEFAMEFEHEEGEEKEPLIDERVEVH